MSARWVFLFIPILWIAGVPGHAQKDVYIPEVEDAMVQGDAFVRDHALVYGGTYSENAAVQDFAIANQTTATDQARLQGKMMSWGSTYEGEVVVGGDAEIGGCAERVYLQVPHPNNGRESCDGHGCEHASNQDIDEITPFPPHQMRFTDETPEAVDLRANYPNPFAKSTSIPFALPTRMRGHLRVYDLLGRYVETLIGGRSVTMGYYTPT